MHPPTHTPAHLSKSELPLQYTPHKSDRAVEHYSKIRSSNCGSRMLVHWRVSLQVDPQGPVVPAGNHDGSDAILRCEVSLSQSQC